MTVAAAARRKETSRRKAAIEKVAQELGAKRKGKAAIDPDSEGAKVVHALHTNGAVHVYDCGHATTKQPKGTVGHQHGALSDITRLAVDAEPGNAADFNEYRPNLPIDQVVPSKTNPREFFDELKIAELAESFRRLGIIEPIVVRPTFRLKSGSYVTPETWRDAPEKWPTMVYELVAGERRYRAAKLAERKTVPVIVRDYTDGQVLEVQIIENLQREGLSPLEEAEGFKTLLAFSGQDGAEAWTVEKLAERVGKSKSYVYGALRLVELPDQARKALAEGRLQRSTAEAIARIPNEKLRKEAATFALKKRWDGEAPTYKDVREEIQEHFMVELKGSPFSQDDAELVPAAGSCKACPKRSGNNRAEFPDGRADICTDPECFRSKIAAHKQRAYEEARKNRLQTLDGDEADTAFKVGIGQFGRSKWLGLQEEWWEGDAGKKTVSAWLGGACLPIAFACNEAGAGFKLVLRKDAVAIIQREVDARAKGRKERAERHVSRAPSEHEVNRRARDLAIQAIGEMATANLEDLGPLSECGGADTNAAFQALHLVAWHAAIRELEDRYGRDPGELPLERRVPGISKLQSLEWRKPLLGWLATAAPPDLLAYLLETVARETLDGYNQDDKEIGLVLLREFTDAGDLKAFQKEARKQLTAELRGKGKGKSGRDADSDEEAE